MKFTKTITEDYEIFYEVLKTHAEHATGAIESINAFYEAEPDYYPKKKSLVSSFVHMLMNRLFNAEQRLHELIVYSLLFRLYRSEAARIKKQKQQKVTAKAKTKQVPVELRVH